jgi:hypothetical protein
MKRLNALKHENTVKQKQLEEYQTRYDQMVKDADEAVKTDAGESETAVVSRLKKFFISKIVELIFYQTKAFTFVGESFK